MTNEAYDLLVALAQRKYPGTKRWYSAPQASQNSNQPEFYLPEIYQFSYCLICGHEFILYQISGGFNFHPIREHGNQHLKESNLLPFL